MKIRSLIRKLVTTYAVRRTDVQLESRRLNRSAYQNAMRFIGVVMLAATTVFLTLLPNSASAGVIYRWENLSTNPGLGEVTGLIEIDYAYWQPGGTITISGTGSVEPGNTPEGNLLSALDSFVFGGDQMPQWTWANLTHPYGFGNLVLTLDGTLKGSIFFHDFQSSVGLDSGSAGSVWTIQDFSSDYPSMCFMHLCGGGTGLWALDINSVPGLPEPATLALLCLALSALAVSRRRRLTNS